MVDVILDETIFVETTLPAVIDDVNILLDEMIPKLFTAWVFVVKEIDPEVVAEITTLSPK